MATGRAGAGAGLAGEPALGSAPPHPSQGSGAPAWQCQPPLMETGRASNILFSRILISIFSFQQHLLPLVSKFQFDVVTRFQYLVVSLLF